MSEVRVDIEVNGERHTATVPARTTLADFLRERLDLTGTHLGCEHGVCGACTVRLDGFAVRSCLVLAASACGSAVWTIEGLSRRGDLADLQDAFAETGGLQCGFCTPGMLITAAELLSENAAPTREEIRAALSGNICRCTGYGPIVDAIERAAARRSGRLP